MNDFDWPVKFEHERLNSTLKLIITNWNFFDQIVTDGFLDNQ